MRVERAYALEQLAPGRAGELRGREDQRDIVSSIAELLENRGRFVWRRSADDRVAARVAVAQLVFDGEQRGRILLDG